ncbi:hypothetical protein CLAVI_000938, partial [Candidatus Clavichlamydia salmonicola]|uniref:hypothetical protein n=1 Tax=Candidatus Clavichlamydia salmonicola TaxID=469812 RepID=UPI0018917ED4
MPYLTLNYYQLSTQKEPTAFIVEETCENLNDEKVESINLLLKDIFNKHLPCAFVPSSFHLDPSIHNNTLTILQDVTLPLLETICEHEINPNITTSLNRLSSTINLCLFGADSSKFLQPIPSISNIVKEKSPQNYSESNTQGRKRSRLPLREISLAKIPKVEIEEDKTVLSSLLQDLKDSFSPFSNDDEFTQEILDSDTFSELTLDPQDDILTSLETASSNPLSCPFIKILSATNRFIIANKPTSHLYESLEHLYDGIRHVLNQQIYIFEPSNFLSRAHAHQQTVSLLLSLLDNNVSLLDLIVNQEDRDACIKEHFSLTKDLKDTLQDNEYIQKEMQTSSFVQKNSSIIDVDGIFDNDYSSFLLTTNDDEFTKNLLDNYTFPELNLDPRNDILTNLETASSNPLSCPSIEILSKTNRFIITSKPTSHLYESLEHLYDGIRHVLDQQIYIFEPSNFLSKAHAHQQTVSLLLSLLDNNVSLLDLIVNQ